MNLPSKEDLKRLIVQQESLCVSLFMPTYRAGRETRQNPIRFKNLITKAERQLETAGLRVSEIQDLLEPGHSLLQNSFFWRNQADGLAVFISPSVLLHYRLPYKFEELAVVNNRFHIKPLLPLFTGDGRFYILALSQNQIKLIQGTHYSVSEINLEHVPRSLSDALQYDNLEKHIQFHTGTPPGPGRRAAMFHGHGGGTDDAKDHILNYFHSVNRALQEFLSDQSAPLVLAGVEYLLSIYKEANTYPHLVEEGIRGNPENLQHHELHDKAWRVVQPLFLKSQKEALAEYRALMSKGKASQDLKIIIPAAYQGKVSVLFVAVGIQKWGKYDPRHNSVNLEKNPTPHNQDLLDASAVHTILNGGTVYAMEKDNIPGQTPIAAIFRY